MPSKQAFWISLYKNTKIYHSCKSFDEISKNWNLEITDLQDKILINHHPEVLFRRIKP